MTLSGDVPSWVSQLWNSEVRCGGTSERELLAHLGSGSRPKRVVTREAQRSPQKYVPALRIEEMGEPAKKFEKEYQGGESAF